MLVEMNGVTKRFPGADALKGIDLEIEAGKIYGLLGPNGSGKSTLLKCIAGLLRPDQGQLKVFDLEPGRETKARIAYLPEVDYLYRWMRIGEMLDLTAAMYSDWQADRVDELLEFMNLKRDQKINGLSKGMRARLKLVMAMTRRADLVLLDEPLSGLDPSSRGRIIDAILQEFQNDHQALIISTHEVGEAEKIFDSVIFLDEGMIKIHEDADQLRKTKSMSIDELFREVFQ